MSKYLNCYELNYKSVAFSRERENALYLKTIDNEKINRKTPTNDKMKREKNTKQIPFSLFTLC